MNLLGQRLSCIGAGRLVEGFRDTVPDPERERAIHRQVWASEWRQANAEPVDLWLHLIRLAPFACPKVRLPGGANP